MASHGPPNPSSRKIVSGNSWRTRASMYCQTRTRHLVAGVATKPIDAAPAPGQKGVRRVRPTTDVCGIQLHQIFPRHAPGAGADKLPSGAWTKPLGMIFIQR